MSEKLTFKEFYSEIRSFFSSHLEDYEDYRNEPTLKKKLEYLLKNEIVKKSLKLLEKSHNNYKILSSHWSNHSMLLQSHKFLNEQSLKFPQLTSKAMISWCKKSGRRIVASKKILPGEIIIREKPYATMLYERFLTSHCLVCFKQLDCNKMSCAICQEVYFCSKLCLDSCSFHHSECGFLPFLQSDQEIGPMALLVFRILIGTGFDICTSVTQTEMDLLQKEAKYDSEDYRAVFLQVDHLDERDPGDVFRRSVTSFFLAQFLRLSHFFPGAQENSEFFSAENESLLLVCSVIVRHLQSCSCNAYEISKMVRTTADQTSLELGGAVYPTVSLTNHSCFPNTMRYNEGNVCILRSSRTINAGEEITDNYGAFYPMTSREERQARLKQQYFFDCVCKACRENWPTIAGIRNMEALWLCQAGLPDGEFCKMRYQILQLIGSLAKILVVEEFHFTFFIELLKCLIWQPLIKACGNTIPSVAVKKKCPKCKKELKTLIKTMKASQSLEKEARAAITKLNQQNQEAIKNQFLTLFLDMEKVVKLPSWNFILCQQVLSQCYTMSGNMINVTETE